MSFPSVIYGKFGDEKRTQTSTFGPPLGTKMILPDGREFVHARAGAATLAVGIPLVQKAVAGTIVNLAVATDAAIGATTVILTMPATTLCTTVDQYAGGFLCVNDVTGEGYTYKIKSSNTAAAASTATFTLEPSDPIVVALANGTSECTIRENTFFQVLARAAGTAAVGAPAGVAPVAVSASSYCWVQRRGEVTCLSGGTVAAAGQQFACATTEASFQFCTGIAADTTTYPVATPWGYVLNQVAASTEYFLGFLAL
jgi:hypothetical protein